MVHFQITLKTIFGVFKSRLGAKFWYVCYTEVNIIQIWAVNSKWCNLPRTWLNQALKLICRVPLDHIILEASIHALWIIARVFCYQVTTILSKFSWEDGKYSKNVLVNCSLRRPLSACFEYVRVDFSGDDRTDNDSFIYNFCGNSGSGIISNVGAFESRWW